RSRSCPPPRCDQAEIAIPNQNQKPTIMQSSLPITTVRAALLGGALLTTFSTAVATDWAEGHGDIAANHVAGEWRFGVLIDSFPGTEFAPHEVLIKAGEN